MSEDDDFLSHETGNAIYPVEVSAYWLKSKNPASEAVRREHEEKWR